MLSISIRSFGSHDGIFAAACGARVSHSATVSGGVGSSGDGSGTSRGGGRLLGVSSIGSHGGFSLGSSISCRIMAGGDSSAKTSRIAAAETRHQFISGVKPASQRPAFVLSAT